MVNEKFLIYVNDLLSTGNIPGLFADDERTQVITQLRSLVKQEGLVDTDENVWDYFIARVKRNLHVVLCFSPVGNTFRDRYRKFPALVNNTSIDWFHQWPQDALTSVAAYFLDDVPLGDTRGDVVDFMAFAHTTVEMASLRYLGAFGRYNYTTPKSFLELISLYKDMLISRKDEIQGEKVGALACRCAYCAFVRLCVCLCCSSPWFAWLFCCH